MDRNSLPLMGIGNLTAEPAMTHTEPSLPLMGIGNAGGPADTAERVGLITPHGDREHMYVADADAHDAVSLPLMGIGNVRIRHGKGGLDMSSLPLMGIGNKAGHELPLRRERLITPHGDREPGTYRRRTSTPRAHYPSWGSGTHPADELDRRGIELITPHGDREPAPRTEENGATLLITPHGDRELLLRRVAQDRTAPLITPHGDRER